MSADGPSAKDKEEAEAGFDSVDVEAGAAGAGSAPSRDIDAGRRRIQLPSEDEPWYVRYSDKGTLSNIVTFVIMVIGLIGVATVDRAANETAAVVWDYVLACGLFGFAGGTTNWLAIKMLFDKIPFIIGSGVIPTRFKEIRETVKDTIMLTFFDKEYLQNYLSQRAGKLIEQLNLEEKMAEELAKPEIDALIQEKLTKAMAAGTPQAQMLMMAAGMIGGPDKLVPMIKPMLQDFGNEMVTMFTKKFDPKTVLDIDKVRLEIDELMTEKLRLLTPDIVKKLIESVIRQHLGWLIVWGNVFGGLIGIISLAAGYGQGS